MSMSHVMRDERVKSLQRLRVRLLNQQRRFLYDQNSLDIHWRHSTNIIPSYLAVIHIYNVNLTSYLIGLTSYLEVFVCDAVHGASLHDERLQSFSLRHSNSASCFNGFWRRRRLRSRWWASLKHGNELRDNNQMHVFHAGKSLLLLSRNMTYFYWRNHWLLPHLRLQEHDTKQCWCTGTIYQYTYIVIEHQQFSTLLLPNWQQL